LPKREAAAAVARTKERCGLGQVGGRQIGRLSKGYQQRVGIAQAIVHNPPVVILDEPTVGLDPIQIREIRALIRQLGGEHSVILSTHILPEIESVCDRVQLMHRGQLVFSGTVEEMRQQRRSDAWLLALHRPPEDGALLALPGVERVERLAEGRFRLHCSAEAIEGISRAAAAQDWGLHQLQAEPTSLEDVFVHLTQREEA
jgi:ABC-2 type transport system ATP-binding protein